MRRARLSVGIGQRHPPPFLIRLRQRNVRVGDVEHRVAGHQRGGVAVRAEAQVNEVEDGRGAGDLPKP